MRPLFVVVAAVALGACSLPPSDPSQARIQYIESTPTGGVVQASTDDAAEEQMRGRCPGGYDILRTEAVPVGTVSTTREGRDLFGNRVAVTDGRTVFTHRYTYACTRYVASGR
jgi:hypothetical protein